MSCPELGTVGCDLWKKREMKKEETKMRVS